MGWETGLAAERDRQTQRRKMARGVMGWAHRMLAASTLVGMAVYHKLVSTFKKLHFIFKK